MRALVVALAALVAVVAAPNAGSARGSEPVRRECGTSVWGNLGTRWRTGSVVAGPLAFVGARGYADSPATFASVGGGRYRASKLLVVVRTGWVARVIVAPAQRSKVALQYAPEHFNTVVVPAETEHDVTFVACPPGRPAVGPTTQRETQFNGGIVVARRRCVTLSVYAAKQGHALPARPIRARLSFGAGNCGA